MWHMHGYWFAWWFGIIFLVLIVLFVVRQTRTDTKTNRSSALDILDERYARGEISRDEYLERKKDITG